MEGIVDRLLELVDVLPYCGGISPGQRTLVLAASYVVTRLLPPEFETIEGGELAGVAGSELGIFVRHVIVLLGISLIHYELI